MQYYTLLDAFLGPLYIMVAFLVAWMIKSKNSDDTRYKHLLPALLLKILGTLAFCGVYTLYYNGGDTIGYFYSAGVLIELMSQNFQGFIEIMFGECTPERYSYFTPETGYPWYWLDDAAFAVVKLTVPVRLLGCGSFLASSVALSCLTFAALWKLYLRISDAYGRSNLIVAVAVLMVPSTIFWTGGILKDTYTMIATAWFAVAVIQWYRKRRLGFSTISILMLTSIIMLFVKPYIFMSLIPAVMLLFSHSRISRIRNVLWRVVGTPIVFLVGVGLAFLGWTVLGVVAPDYASVDDLIVNAHMKQVDLKQDYYGGNSFDIGDYEPTVSGALGKFPQAVVAGLLRPYIWEARNIVMIVSGLENLILLLLIGYLVLFRFRSILQSLKSNPFQVFCISFSICLAFVIGLSTSNFGSLVRFKLPFMPFFVLFLVAVLERIQVSSESPVAEPAIDS